MLAAEDASVADGLLLLSYPLHPPAQPEKLRTEHFPMLGTPALFVHGTRDEFGTLAEMEAALQGVAGRTQLQSVVGGHGLATKFAAQIADWFVTFTSK
jgi:predicted alpha/beta-hydrolase family hydrolase